MTNNAQNISSAPRHWALRLSMLGMVGITMPLLSGCAGIDLYAPGKVLESRAQVHEEQWNTVIPLADLDDAAIASLARDYSRYGGSTMELRVTYNPYARHYTAMRATERVSDIVEDLKSHGVHEIKPSIMPVRSGDEPQLMVSYLSYRAEIPVECRENKMPGLDKGHTLERNRDYVMGCGIEDMIVQQVSRPSDLIGRSGNDRTSEGRSASNIVNTHRIGARNAELGGETATGD